MSDIFISYAKEDQERARVLAEDLKRRGWSVWWDRIIPTGRAFDAVIEEEIDAARCVVVLWSASSVKSDWVKAEAARAQDRGKLFPVLIERVSMPLAFSRFQAADLVGWSGGTRSEGLAQLVGDLKRALDSSPMRADSTRAAETIPKEGRTAVAAEQEGSLHAAAVAANPGARSGRGCLPAVVIVVAFFFIGWAAGVSLVGNTEAGRIVAVPIWLVGLVWGAVTWKRRR